MILQNLQKEGGLHIEVRRKEIEEENKRETIHRHLPAQRQIQDGNDRLEREQKQQRVATAHNS